MNTIQITNDAALTKYCTFFQLQSIVWAVLAFLGLALYTCELEVTYEKDNPVYYLYFVYFFSKYMVKAFEHKNLLKAVSQPF